MHKLSFINITEINQVDSSSMLKFVGICAISVGVPFEQQA
jgi:hypothetical protein